MPNIPGESCLKTKTRQGNRIKEPTHILKILVVVELDITGPYHIIAIVGTSMNLKIVDKESN